jgi:hypothetical protein
VKRGKDVGAVIGVLVREHDRIDHVWVDRQTDEGPRTGITPDPGLALLDQVPRRRPARNGESA